MLTNYNLKLPYIVISHKDSNISASRLSSEVQPGPTLLFSSVFPVVSCTQRRRQVRIETSRLSCAVKVNGLWNIAIKQNQSFEAHPPLHFTTSWFPICRVLVIITLKWALSATRHWLINSLICIQDTYIPVMLWVRRWLVLGCAVQEPGTGVSLFALCSAGKNFWIIALFKMFSQPNFKASISRVSAMVNPTNELQSGSIKFNPGCDL